LSEAGNVLQNVFGFPIKFSEGADKGFLLGGAIGGT
jgi:hypothetical protein